MSSFVQAPCDRGVAEAGPAAGECARSARPFVLAATILGSSMAFIDGTVVHVALPAMQRDLSASVAEMQWIVNAYTLLLGALMLVGGSAGDRFGRRRVFVAGVWVFAIASVACGLAPDTGTLIAARALQGLGGAMLVPGSLAIISASFPKAERGRAIGTWAGFAALTTAAGPILGGWLVDTLSWPAIFFINVPLAALTVALALRYVPESRDDATAGALDWPGAVLAVSGFAALTYGLVASADAGFGAPPVAASLVAGVALIAAFLWVEARSTAPMMPLGLFRSASFAGANALTFCLYFALSGALFFLPFNLIQVQGYSATAAGAAFLPFTLVMAGLSRWTGGLIDRFGPRPPLIAGPLIAAAALAMLALPGIGGSYWATFFPAMVLLGIGMAVSVAPLTTTVMNAVEERRGGVASGINNAASRLAGMIAVAVLGAAAVGLYGPALADRLDAVNLSAAARASVLETTQELAAARPPEGLDTGQARAVEEAIDGAFVASFRWIMAGTALLAVFGALIAALTIRPDDRPDRADAAPGTATPA